MSLVFAMPSPSGRNDEKLFTLRGRRDPRAAFDAEPGDDPDAGPKGTNPKQISDWAKTNLSADEIAELCALLTDGTDAPSTASDSRPHIGLGARRAGPRAIDTASAEAAFTKQFPGSTRPRVL